MFSYSVLLGLLAFSSVSGMCFFIPELTFVGAMVSFGICFCFLGRKTQHVYKEQIGGGAALALVFFAWVFFFPFISAIASVLSLLACIGYFCQHVSELEKKAQHHIDPAFAKFVVSPADKAKFVVLDWNTVMLQYAASGASKLTH